jgi:hypothetical protein
MQRESPPLRIPRSDAAPVQEEQWDVEDGYRKSNPQPEIFEGNSIVGIAAIDPAPILYKG